MPVDGSWTITIHSPMGDQRGVLDLAVHDGFLTGNAAAMGTRLELAEGTVDGDRVTFSMRVKRPMPMRLRFDLAVDGDDLHGHVVAGPFGKQQVTGHRA